MPRLKRPKSAKPRIKRAEREEQILSEAEAEFCTHGVASARMEDIAARCGVTKPLLYSYFGSKKGLFTAVLERYSEALSSRLIAVAERSLDPDQMEAALFDLMQFIQQNGRLLRTLPVGLRDDPDFGHIVRKHQARTEQELLKVVAKLYRCGLPEAQVMEIASPYVFALLGAAEGGLQWWGLRPHVRADEAQRLTRRVLSAMLALIAEDLQRACTEKSAIS